MKKLFLICLCLIAFLCVSCEAENEDEDQLTSVECEDLVDEIYLECERTLPFKDGEYPSDSQALEYCRDNEKYDWVCVDDCVFNYKRLCPSLQMCLESCD